MKALRAPSPVPPLSLIRSRFFKPVSGLSFTLNKPHSPLTCLTHFKKSKFNNFTAISPSAVSTESLDQDEKFDWYSQWYAIMPVCDLDKRAPHGKKVMGLDVVVWSDKNENAWKVFDDMCPHRLAPLSEGRIDQWGRLQCVYHGWCFSGSGDCKLIPQAPLDGPLVHTLKRRVSVCIQAPCKTELFGFGPTLIRDTKISSQRRNHHTSLRLMTLHLHSNF